VSSLWPRCTAIPPQRGLRLALSRLWDLSFRVLECSARRADEQEEAHRDCLPHSVVRGELSERYAAGFEGMRMERREGQTILTGEVKDQPHLFGILQRLNGLGLELLSVETLPHAD
jgi:hypothetical protein